MEKVFDCWGMIFHGEVFPPHVRVIVKTLKTIYELRISLLIYDHKFARDLKNKVPLVFVL